MQAQVIPARADTDAPNLHAVGAAVRELRARRGLSQEWLGYRAGLHRNYIGAIERGTINPTFRTLTYLMGGLMLPLSELVVLYERNVGERRRAA
jgi:transcriptional regulator with XRE-family HTH domain